SLPILPVTRENVLAAFATEADIAVAIEEPRLTTEAANAGTQIQISHVTNSVMIARMTSSTTVMIIDDVFRIWETPPALVATPSMPLAKSARALRAALLASPSQSASVSSATRT